MRDNKGCWLKVDVAGAASGAVEDACMVGLPRKGSSVELPCMETEAELDRNSGLELPRKSRSWLPRMRALSVNYSYRNQVIKQ